MKLAVGFFDGVHLGHQAILAGADAALTFREHPISVLAPERAPFLIMTLEQRIAAIRSCGVKDVLLLDFTPELAAITPSEFVQVLRSKVPAGESLQVRCGDNWHFGCGGKGNADFLRERGITTEVVPYAVWNGDTISSSRIRSCLAKGDIVAANAMLGHDYEIVGEVISGKGMGKGMGYPTINVAIGGKLNLFHGVYAVSVEGVIGVANYGYAPTMGDLAWKDPVLEVHLLGRLPVDVVGEVSVRFHGFIREERRFGSVEELTAQIGKDCIAAENFKEMIK